MVRYNSGPFLALLVYLNAFYFSKILLKLKNFFMFETNIRFLNLNKTKYYWWTLKYSIKKLMSWQVYCIINE